jgi:hypothetical protein
MGNCGYDLVRRNPPINGLSTHVCVPRGTYPSPNYARRYYGYGGGCNLPAGPFF